jgi:hypothetical protein
MAFVPSCRYDLFLSYAHIDNKPGPDERHWVSDFHQYLKTALEQNLGTRKLEIFFDPRLRANQQLPELLDAAASSAIFLAIGSPAWIESEFCGQEIETFASASPDPSRRFLVQYLPLGPGKAYPEAMSKHLWMEFHTSPQEPGAPKVPLSPAREQNMYTDRILRLASDIADRLRGFDTKATPKKAPPPAHYRRVLVAEPTDDLEDASAALIAELEQFGIPVKRAPASFMGPAAFKTQFEAAIEDCDLFVQLLSYPGKRPPELPQGFAQFQADAAAASGRPVMQWRSPDLQVDGLAEGFRDVLRRKEVTVSTLAAFKEDVRAAATAAPPAPEPPLGPDDRPVLVFVNADQPDWSTAEAVSKVFKSRKLIGALPLKEGNAGECLADLRENLKSCEAFVMVYGEAGPAWVRAQIRRYTECMRERKHAAKIVAVYAGPPVPKSPLALEWDALRQLDGGAAWDLAPIHKLADELLG